MRPIRFKRLLHIPKPKRGFFFGIFAIYKLSIFLTSNALMFCMMHEILPIFESRYYEWQFENFATFSNVNFTNLVILLSGKGWKHWWCPVGLREGLFKSSFGSHKLYYFGCVFICDQWYSCLSVNCNESFEERRKKTRKFGKKFSVTNFRGR